VSCLRLSEHRTRVKISLNMTRLNRVDHRTRHDYNPAWLWRRVYPCAVYVFPELNELNEPRSILSSFGLVRTETSKSPCLARVRAWKSQRTESYRAEPDQARFAKPEFAEWGNLGQWIIQPGAERVIYRGRKTLCGFYGRRRDSDFRSQHEANCAVHVIIYVDLESCAPLKDCEN